MNKSRSIVRKALLFYFSGTGNTQWIVKQLMMNAEQYELSISAYSIEKVTPALLSELQNQFEECSFIGFAYPVYGADIPPIVRKFLVMLSDYVRNSSLDMGHKSGFVCTTFGYVNGFGPLQIRKLLNRFNLTLRYHVNFRMVNNIRTPEMVLKPITPQQLAKRKNRAVKKIHSLLCSMTENRKMIRGFGPYIIGGYLVRKITRKHIEKTYSDFSVNMYHCNRCMTCIRQCPTHSISFMDNQFHFSPDCTACFRCFNNCKTGAILHKGTYCDPVIYPRHSITE